MIKNFSFKEDDFRSELQNVTETPENKLLINELAQLEVEHILLSSASDFKTEFSKNSDQISDNDFIKLGWLSDNTRVALVNKLNELILEINKLCRTAENDDNNNSSIKEALHYNSPLLLRMYFKKEIAKAIIEKAKSFDENVLSTLIGYSSNIHNNVSSVLEGILNTLIGDGNNIQGDIAEALEGILKARKEALDKVDNKPGNIVYTIEAMCLGQLFKYIVGILEESGNSPITPGQAKEWSDKYDVVIKFIEPE